ncbi:biopolymer transporter ExbD [Ruficoccus amylovorans]|uniref:Biopolymer transporter ExbD n=1 Tax=Ruficoccus amylovorans TaxID=1804625 RepID=A0A842HGB3_9BACT|nr:biopolymer transporter ExbD [Ruficoccus amylovorans]MBC2595329.1 biopolymer transporter ExbD [Ruficoccus amylovorans]
MRLRKREHPEADFQMAPMIDMVFLLLVFFLYAGTLARADRVREVDLPESAESRVPDNPAHRVTLSLDADGTAWLGAESLTLPQLGLRLERALTAQPDLSVEVRADRATPYGKIRPVLDACAQAGASEVIYATFQGN